MRFKLIIILATILFFFGGISHLSYYQSSSSSATSSSSTGSSHGRSSTGTTTIDNRINDHFTNTPTHKNDHNDKHVEVDDHNNNHKNIQPTPTPEFKPTIFVSLASYRDVWCSDTINYLFKNADHPENVFIGLVDQGSELLEVVEPEHPSYPNSLCYRGLTVSPELIKSNVRRVTLEKDKARGPTLARHLASTLYRNEMYFMQIDSHLRFIKGWDTFAMSNHWSLRGIAPTCKHGVPKAILTHYPMPWEESNPGLPSDDQHQVPRLCKAIFHDQGLITFNSFILPATKIPKECPFAAAGFFFAPGEIMDSVPYDPHLPNMFEGEEILHSARLWAAGFRFYGPTLNLCYHYYIREKHPKFWDDNKTYYNEMSDSTERGKYILGLVHDEVDLTLPKYSELDKYGMSKKTAADFWNYIEVNIPLNTQNESKWCTN
ncbi:hypothetical protein SAMD00019534_065350 [Acytostelium subglobosum LB1]|uniref:hypothetical protein n=1 Tax=Acytostelium subglobosum LB1 TaxID=1410327 RepID=UPI000644C5B4|nr:hypothetical protein SAMD00019534_065350 [Acytostelium subglobosum LB1]GAM23360.1 hypothetical protein SAMD00019534_065350 [Acytostelium subglobosum LB1]|eukprot:XP_012753809.1 hypothetical protein SAMD00019534_065350 [Acytostelium subglobosum LB1]